MTKPVSASAGCWCFLFLGDERGMIAQVPNGWGEGRSESSAGRTFLVDVFCVSRPRCVSRCSVTQSLLVVCAWFSFTH